MPVSNIFLLVDQHVCEKYTGGQATQMVMDSDYDPGQDSQDSQDETDISDVSDTDIMDKALDTEYMDKVIKQDGAVQVKACRHICGEHDSSSSFDHSSEFEKDETALTPPPQDSSGAQREENDMQFESTPKCFCQREYGETRCGPLSGANKHPEWSWCCYGCIWVQLQK